MPDSGRASSRGPAVLVFGAALLAYAGNLANGFVYDDRYVVERNPLVQNVKLAGLLTTPYWGEIVGAGLYRPVPLLSFGLNRALGPSAFGFHLVNDVLHGLAAVLAFLIVRALGLSSAGALAAGLLFALHPVQSEAVNALVGRAEILAFSFVALSLLLFARKANPLLVGGSFFVALLSKESAIFTLPLFALYRRDGARLFALGGALVAGAAIRIAVLGGLGISGREIGFLDNPLAGAGFGGRALAAPVLLFQYVKLVLWPWPLSADYSFDQIPLPEGVADFRVLAGALALSLFVYAIVRGGTSRIAALVFAVPLAGTLHLLFPLGTIFAERLLYLPMLGAALAFGLLIESLAARRTWISAAVAVVVLGASAAAVLKRIPDWRDNETLFRRTVATAAASARSHFLLGAELLEQKRFTESAEWFLRGLEIYPAHFGARMSLGEALLEAGDPGGAEREFRKALDAEPGSADARKAAIEAALSHGRERARGSDFAAAKESFERAIALDENHAPAWNYLGLVAEREGRVEDARLHYQRALGIDATSVEALLNLASLELNAGGLSGAEKLYRRAIELAPGSYEAYNGLGIALARQGRVEEAAAAFEKAIAIDPGLSTARENLRALSSKRGIG